MTPLKITFRDASGNDSKLKLETWRIENGIIRGQQKIRGVLVNRSIPLSDVVTSNHETVLGLEAE